MCTLVFSYRQHDAYPLLLAANRDEFHERPTRTMHWWEDDPHILGGRDEREGGTWFGITRSGRLAVLTNFRAFPQLDRAPSRGHLVRDFLRRPVNPEAFLHELLEHGPQYNGFNLLFGYPGQLWYYSNRGGEHGELAPGLYGLSNALLNEPWPKLLSAREAFARLFAEPDALNEEEIFAALSDTTRYPAELLPQTGLSPELEHALSALFIETPGYGTRASWFLRAESGGTVEVAERSHLPEGYTRERFALQDGSSEARTRFSPDSSSPAMP
jgi:uncharacterized protein with NRDE domain